MLEITSTDCTAAYQIVLDNGSALPAEPKWNAVPPFTCTDNAGNTRTDCSIPAFVGAGGTHASGLVPDPGATPQNLPLCDTGTFSATCQGSGGGSGLLPNPVLSASLFAAPPWLIQVDQASIGPNPSIDIRNYGARAVATAPSATVNISSGSSTAILNAASTFQNNDWVVIPGAGATCGLSTPSAPTVTPSQPSTSTGTGNVVNSSTGSTAYAYQIVAISPNGCYTLPSTSGTTSTGLASLGSQSVALTSEVMSNNTVTVTTSSPHQLPTGCNASTCPVVQIQNTSDSRDYGGTFRLSSVPDNTHFTYITSADTRTGATASATGGTAYYYNANRVAWSGTASAIAYAIYGRTAGSLALIGISKPNTSLNTDFTFDDYGATMTSSNTSFLSWLPSSPPGAASPEPLYAQISSGAGTTTLNLTASATNTVTSGSILFDNNQAILAAATAAVSTGGTVYIPAITPGTSFIGNSFIQLPDNTTVSQAGPISLNQTIACGRHIQWFGDLSPQPSSSVTTSFQLSGGAIINVGAANPGILCGLAGSPLLETFRNVNFIARANAHVSLFIDQGQFLNLDNVSFANGNGSNYDYMGVGLYVRAPSNNGFQPTMLNRVSFLGSSPATVGSTSTPLLVCAYCGSASWDRLSFGIRGAFMQGGTLNLKWLYNQGGIVPALTLFGAGSLSTSIKVSDVVLDTMAQPIIGATGGNFTNITLDNVFVGPSSDTGGPLPAISGFPVYGIANSNNLSSTNRMANSETTLVGTIGDGNYSGTYTGTLSEKRENQLLATGAGIQFSMPIFLPLHLPARYRRPVLSGHILEHSPIPM